MSVFEPLLFWKNWKKKAEPVQPDVLFGRFAEIKRSAEQNAAWESATKKFEAGEQLAAWEGVLKFLKHAHQENLTFEKTADGLQFTLVQGSKKIFGWADALHFRAEARIAMAGAENVGYLRMLVEHNRLLKYTRFALDPENRIVMLFDSAAADAAPLKILAGLKELATQADKHDDILIDEFPVLTAIDEGVQFPISEAEKQVKIDFLRKKISETFEKMEKAALRPEFTAGAQAYLLLHLIYSLDFLVRPEGFTMETLERIHRSYFENDGRNKTQKIITARRDLQKILDRSDDELRRELYRTIATFGITRPVDHEKIVQFIDGEQSSLQFLIDTNQPEIALSVPGYVAGYSMFNYALPKPDHALFLLFFKITEADYFKKLGFEHDFWKNGGLNGEAIKAEIDRICEQNRADFPQIKPATGILKFDSLPLFAQSFLALIRHLNLTPAE